MLKDFSSEQGYKFVVLVYRPLFKDSSPTVLRIKMNKEKLALWSFSTRHNSHNYTKSKTDSYFRQKRKSDIITSLAQVFRKSLFVTPLVYF